MDKIRILCLVTFAAFALSCDLPPETPGTEVPEPPPVEEVTVLAGQPIVTNRITDGHNQVVFSDADGETLYFHNQSGELSMVSPDDRWIGMHDSKRQWWLYDLTRGQFQKIHSSDYNGASNGRLQWTPDSLLLRTNGSGSKTIEFYNPATQFVEATIDYPAIDVTWPGGPTLNYASARSGDSSHRRILHLVYNASYECGDKDFGRNWVIVIDAGQRALSPHGPWQFDDVVTRGQTLDQSATCGSTPPPGFSETRSGQWHHFFPCGADRFCPTLSGYAAGGPPNTWKHFIVNVDGSGWKVTNPQIGGPKVMSDPKTLHWSHVVYSRSDPALVAFGHADGVYVYNLDTDTLVDSDLANTTPNQGGWHHGFFDESTEALFYTFSNWSSGTETGLWKWAYNADGDPGPEKVVSITDNEAGCYTCNGFPFLNTANTVLFANEGDPANRIAVRGVMTLLKED